MSPPLQGIRWKGRSWARPLDLEVRRRIIEAVQASPGLHLRALSGRLGVPPSTLAYHCRILGREGYVESQGTPHIKSLYPANLMDRRDKAILFSIHHPARRSVCSHLLANKGSTPGELKRVLGISGPALSFHLRKLSDAGVTLEEPGGRTKRLFLREPERVANILATYGACVLDWPVWRRASPQPAPAQPA